MYLIEKELQVYYNVHSLANHILNIVSHDILSYYSILIYMWINEWINKYEWMIIDNYVFLPKIGTVISSGDQRTFKNNN